MGGGLPCFPGLIIRLRFQLRALPMDTTRHPTEREKEMFGPHTRVIDVKPENRIKSVEKVANGDMMVEFHSGQRGSLAKTTRKPVRR